MNLYIAKVKNKQGIVEYKYVVCEKISQVEDMILKTINFELEIQEIKIVTEKENFIYLNK